MSGDHAYREVAFRGGRFGFFERGAGGSPLLVLHASGTGAASLLPLAEALSASRRIVIPDLHGYGLSHAEGATQIARHRRIVDAALARLGTPADILGHSMGGALAVMAALDRPRAARRLVLIEPILLAAVDPGNAAAMEALARDRQVTAAFLEAVAAGDPDRGLSAFCGSWNDIAFEALSAETQARLRRLAPVMAAEVAALAEWRSPRARFGALRQRTLLIAGSRAPPAAHAMLRGLAALLPRADSCVIDGLGHMGPVHAPETVASRVCDFLAGE